MNTTEKIKNYLAAHKEDLLRDLEDLIRIDSARTDALPDAPFGPGVSSCFKTMEEKITRYGFTFTDYDHYVICADFSDAPKALDILAHLDVVPGGEGWTVTSPFVPLIEGDRIYGRGSSDDKGPALAALYAMRAIKDLELPLSKNVRLILGGSEETGSEDIQHYYVCEPEAPMTFSPDGSFPVINLEKGRMCPVFSAAAEPNGSIYVASIEAGLCFNMVPPSAKAVVVGLSVDELTIYANKAQLPVSIAFENSIISSGENAVTIIVTGAGGHASAPFHFKNALTALLSFLASLPLSEGKLTSLLTSASQLFPYGDHIGVALGIAMEDEISGKLTCSLDMFSYDGHHMTGTFDCRVPVCGTVENCQMVAIKNLEANGFTVDCPPMVACHHVPADSPFVKTLLSCYEEITQKPGYAMAIGGGTYVHDLERGVAFGCGESGVDNHMHGADEFMLISQIMVSAEIFALAILKLCE